METHTAATPQGLPPSLDTTIHVNRHLVHLYWRRDLVYPEATSPDEFNLADLSIVHYGHEGPFRVGQIYHRVKSRKNLLGAFGFTDTGLTGLKGCLDIADGLAIREAVQKKGLGIFRKFFSGKTLWLMRSVVNKGGTFAAPCLFEVEGQDKVELHFRVFDAFAPEGSVTAHFPR